MPESIRIDGNLVLQVNDPVEALRMLATAGMKPFTRDDWDAFAGCETKNPMIGVVGDFVIILDGAMLGIYHSYDGYGGTLFELVGRN